MNLQMIWGPVAVKRNSFTKKYRVLYGPAPKPSCQKSLFDIYLERNVPSVLLDSSRN